MKVVWSDRAVRSLADIHLRIAEESHDVANRVVDAILRRGDSLADFPDLGRAVDRYRRLGVRELIEAPYRIVYRRTRNVMQVIDIFHSSQLPPWER